MLGNGYKDGIKTIFYNIYNKMIGIYKITNPKGKIYIGQSTDIEGRKIYYLKLKCTRQPKIYNSLLKYGWEQHVFEIIEECSLELLNEREIYWGLMYNVLGENGLNLKLGDGRGICSEETKQKLSESLKGRIQSEETKQKISSSKLGIKYSDETKQKMSEKLLGKPKSEQHKQNMGLAKKGNTYRLGSKHTQQGKDTIGLKNKHPKPKDFGLKISQNKERARKSAEGKYKPILQFDLEGKFIQEWVSAKIAEEFHHPSKQKADNIGACCRGKIKTAYNYIWKFKIKN